MSKKARKNPMPSKSELLKKEKCPRRAVVVEARRIPQDVIHYGVSTEHAISQIEKENTIVFVCDMGANKPEIRKAVEALYGAAPEKVRTAITFKGVKKAYVKFPAEVSALEIASRASIV